MSIFLALSLLAGPVAAEVPTLAPLKLQARYEVSWGGLTLGRINLDIDEDALGYHITVDTKTSGIAKLFSDEKTVAQTIGHRATNGEYLPSKYSSRRLREDGGMTELRYDATGKLAFRERKPDDDPAWRPPVPLELVNTATDPLTAGLILRRTLRDHMAQEERNSVIRSYDGARLGEFNCKVVSRARVEINDEYRDAINTVVTRKPIAGYTPKEKRKFDEGDPIIHLYFSADKELIPLKLTIATGYGEVAATLVRREGAVK